MSVTAARGFQAAGVAAGIKAGGQRDLALVAADELVATAAVFTRSATAAAPVLLSRRRVQAGRARAVLLNSGCANAGTGAAGLAAAEKTTAATANSLACAGEEVLVCSTGPIGPLLPVDVVIEAIPGLVARLGGDAEHGLAAAQAILTTDSHTKQAIVEVDEAVVGGMAKGAAMLRPDMATMLAVLTTDLVAEPVELAEALQQAVATTFNCLDVDGCQSTNDTVVVMASGRSGHRLEPEELAEALRLVCADLAWQMADDAEGATKVVTIEVSGAESIDSARRIGLSIADSALVRSSFYGADPNWGRVLAAIGVSGVTVDPALVDIAYDGTTVCKGGAGVRFDEASLSSRLGEDFEVSVEIGSGPGSARILTTDLTPEYVRFNGDRS
jgi:glutamate N-acetyltransferase / amino-acid N-acetyltransferase